jgi:hypothetical protein
MNPMIAHLVEARRDGGGGQRGEGCECAEILLQLRSHFSRSLYYLVTLMSSVEFI